MNRAERARAKRNEYLFAHTDSETANHFINLWDNAESGKVCDERVRQAKNVDRQPIFTNYARNKLTEYGQKVALDYLLQIPLVERTCKFARYDFEELQKQLSQGFSSLEQKEMFVSIRDAWFQHLKERMKELSIKKETLESYGLNWKQAKNFAYQTL